MTLCRNREWGKCQIRSVLLNCSWQHTPWLPVGYHVRESIQVGLSLARARWVVQWSCKELYLSTKLSIFRNWHETRCDRFSAAWKNSPTLRGKVRFQKQFFMKCNTGQIFRCVVGAHYDLWLVEAKTLLHVANWYCYIPEHRRVDEIFHVDFIDVGVTKGISAWMKPRSITKDRLHFKLPDFSKSLFRMWFRRQFGLNRVVCFGLINQMYLYFNGEVSFRSSLSPGYDALFSRSDSLGPELISIASWFGRIFSASVMSGLRRRLFQFPEITSDARIFWLVKSMNHDSH